MSRRTVVIALVGIVLAAFLFVVLSEPQLATSPFAMGNADANGARALGLYLQAHGWHVQPQVGRPSQVPPERGVLLVPPEVLMQLTEAESAELIAWAEAGGRLIALGQAVDESMMFHFVMGERLTTPRVRAVEPSGHFPGVNELAQTFQRWRANSPPAEWDEWKVWLQDDLGFIVLASRHGRGDLLVLPGPEPLTNIALDQADNLPFALQLVEAGVRDVLGFYTRDPAIVAQQAAASRKDAALPLNWQLAAGSIGLAAIAAFWLLGRRTGPILPPEPPLARPLTEYVTAQAHAYLRAKAGAAALGFLAADLRKDLAAASGLPATAPVSLLAGPSANLGLSPSEVEAVLTDLEAGGRPSHREVQRLAAAVAALQRRMKRRVR